MRKHILPILILALAALAMMPLSASAATVSSGKSHHTHHYPHFFLKKDVHHHQNASPLASGNNLNYGGGPVMGGTANVYAIFWEPTGSVSSNYNSLILRYFGDVGGSPLYNNNTQYTDSSGNRASNTVLAGSWVDNSTYPESPLLDSDIQNEVTNAQNVASLISLTPSTSRSSKPSRSSSSSGKGIVNLATIEELITLDFLWKWGISPNFL